MGFLPVVLWTDWAALAVLAGLIAYAVHVGRTPHLAATWRKALQRPVGAVTATLLGLVVLVGVVDSLHFRAQVAVQDGQPVYAPETLSVLDLVLARQREMRETSYSAPLAWQAFDKDFIVRDGQTVRDYPRLDFGGAHLRDPAAERVGDVVARGGAGLAGGVAAAVAVLLALAALRARVAGGGVAASVGAILRGRTPWPLRPVWILLAALCLWAGPIVALAGHYHVFGTDRVGNDLLYLALKSIRTSLVIGTMTTLVTLPIALGLGLAAGYLRGWVDEVIQYVYTVLNAIPYVLLIAASVLILVTWVDANPDLFPTSAQRTDARLFFLCVILGVTSWTELARLVRGEVLRLRELDYVQAAHAFGVGPLRIMVVHLVPNLVHVVLINIVIAFSGLVLAEAVLSYVGVGVDPSTASFGMLINTAKNELMRDPVVWWTLATAFVFMFAIVLAANLFADAVRDAFDPRQVTR